MKTYHATSANVWTEIDYGEGYISFQWPDPVFGVEGLKIDLDFHCSRNMPIRSGDGVPDFVSVERDVLRLRFDPVLAKKLELDEEIEIYFSLNDPEFAKLQKAIDYFQGESTDSGK